MNKNIAERISQAAAASHILILNNDSTLNYADAYKLVSSEPKIAFQSDQFSVHDDYQAHEDEGLLESITGLARNVEGSLNEYAALMKEGAKIHAMHGDLSTADVAQWDMDDFAKLGLAIKNGIIVDQAPYFFDLDNCEWINADSGPSVSINACLQNNFLPEKYSLNNNLSSNATKQVSSSASDAQEYTINTFDSDGAVNEAKTVYLSRQSVEDIISHAAQVVLSNGDEDVCSELYEALNVYEIIDSGARSRSSMSN